jgi:hypothetical protein
MSALDAFNTMTPTDNKKSFRSTYLDFEDCCEEEINRFYSSMTYLEPQSTSKKPKYRKHVRVTECPTCDSSMYKTYCSSESNSVLLSINNQKTYQFWKNECSMCNCNWYEIQLPIKNNASPSVIEPVVPKHHKFGFYELFVADFENMEDWPYWIVFPGELNKNVMRIHKKCKETSDNEPKLQEIKDETSSCKKKLTSYCAIC